MRPGATLLATSTTLRRLNVAQTPFLPFSLRGQLSTTASSTFNQRELNIPPLQVRLSHRRKLDFQTQPFLSARGNASLSVSNHEEIPADD
jgi:hypothetical protein